MVGAETVFGEMELVHYGKWIGDYEEARRRNLGVLKLIVQLGVEESGGNETVKTLIEKESGSEDAIVNLEDVLPDDRSYFAFEVPSNGKESALRKVVFNKKVVVSRATLTFLSGSVDRVEHTSSEGEECMKIGEESEDDLVIMIS